ncbi:terminase [Pasteurellaceae bacterium TAE3-ERU1]|nr:terminase [Pasteurellaceae bacterium TAE3-ERU1]
MGIRQFQAEMQALEQLEAQQRVTAATLADNVPSAQSAVQIALQNDLNKIREFPSLAERAKYKRDQFLPKWQGLVEDYLNGDQVYQNDLLVYCIIFSFDAGELGRALQWADTAIAQSQAMPAGFKSNLPTFVADQVFNWADRLACVGRSVEPYFTDTLEKVTTQWRLHEVVTAKWYKAAAQLLLRNAQGKVHAPSVDDTQALQMALFMALQAQTLNHKAGVNDFISRIQMRLNKLHPNADQMAALQGLTMADCLAKIRSRISNGGNDV